MAHLNSLQKKFGKRGLTVVGVTDGDEKGTVPWIEKMGVRYPWGYETSHFAFRSTIWVYPHALLISPRGTVIWSGPAGDVTDELIRKNLDGAIDRPLWTWPKAFEPVKKAIAVGDWKRALTLSGGLAEDDESARPLAATVRHLLALRVEGIEETYQAGDAFVSWQSAHALKDHVAGSEFGPRIAGLIREMNAKPEFRTTYLAQAKVFQIIGAGAKNRAAALEQVEQLGRIAEAHRDSIPGKEAAIHRRYLGRMITEGLLK